MRRILCRLLGHKLPEFLRNGRLVTYEGTAADTGAHSYTVQQPCARCGRRFLVGYVQVRGPGLPPDLL